jgi:pimeloyl-ACP methyl ester carboxylesterase
VAALQPFQVEVPADVLADLTERLRRTRFPNEVAGIGFNVVHWTELPRGGHFPAMEVPDLFVADVRAFFRGLR